MEWLLARKVTRALVAARVKLIARRVCCRSREGADRNGIPLVQEHLAALRDGCWRPLFSVPTAAGERLWPSFWRYSVGAYQRAECELGKIIQAAHDGKERAGHHREPSNLR